MIAALESNLGRPVDLIESIKGHQAVKRKTSPVLQFNQLRSQFFGNMQTTGIYVNSDNREDAHRDFVRRGRINIELLNDKSR